MMRAQMLARYCVCSTLPSLRVSQPAARGQRSARPERQALPGSQLRRAERRQEPQGA